MNHTTNVGLTNKNQMVSLSNKTCGMKLIILFLDTMGYTFFLVIQIWIYWFVEKAGMYQISCHGHGPFVKSRSWFPTGKC